MTTTTYTPWGWTRDIEELAEGVWRVSTASHGGLKLSRERWASKSPPKSGTLLTPDLRGGGLRGTHRQDAAGPGRRPGAGAALKVAGYFDRYAPALPYHRGKGVGDGYDHAA